ncbi:MAG: GNAT family N-acetyltransferase [Terracoccus sp.]
MTRQGPGFTVRALRPEDHERLGLITAGAYLADPMLGFTAETAYLDVLRDVGARAADSEVLVAADDDGTLLGSVAFVSGPGPFADVAGPGEAEFRMLAVDAAAQGRGVGRALVEACVERARQVPGCRLLVLSTQVGMLAARRIYESRGFVRDPARDWSPVPGLTLLAYVLELD